MSKPSRPLLSVLMRLRCLITVVLLCLLGSAAARSLPAGSGQQEIDLWPVVTLLQDHEHLLGLAQVRSRTGEFRAPDGPAQNLGPRRETVWLRMPLAPQAGDQRWIFELDYPMLQQAELWQVRDGVVVAQHRLGADQHFPLRPMPTRSHAVALDLKAGAHEELYLRVRTSTAMVLPLRLVRPDHFLIEEQRVQLLGGLIAGVALTLLIYSLLHAVGLRSELFAMYALMVCSSAMFSLTYAGLAQQYLWPQPTPLTIKAAPMAVLLAVVGAARFVSSALELRHRDPRFVVPLDAMAAGALVLFVLAGAGVLDYRPTQVAASIFGPGLIALAVPAAWRAARRGDPVGWFMLIGWSAYLVGVLGLAGLLRGWVPANQLTMHLCQIGWLIEMLAWLRVLGLHVEDVRRAAEQAELQRRTMETLACTDALTGLPNRRGLEAAIAPALAAAAPQQLLALYMLDLDGFKPVNDRLGHDAGDELLVLVGQRLKKNLRSSDVVTRIGGDEFVVLAGGLGDEDDALTIGTKLLRAFDEPFFLASGEPCRVGLTIGYALAPQDGTDADSLLKRADTAMYSGKQAGRHCLRRGTPAEHQFSV